MDVGDVDGNDGDVLALGDDADLGDPAKPGSAGRRGHDPQRVVGAVLGDECCEAVDQRADVYAFGLILYDLLAGRTRVHPDGAIAELQARMKQAPPVLKTLVPDVPEALTAMEHVVLQPHMGSSIVEVREERGRKVLANLRAHFAGKPVLTPM